MKIYLLPLLILLSFNLSAQQDSDIIMTNIRNENRNSIKSIDELDQSVTELLKKNNSDGTWDDIDYKMIERTKWQPVQHIERIATLSNAYTIPESTYFEDVKLFNTIEQALKFWDNLNPISKNWWFNEIAVPKKLGHLLIVLRKGARQIDESLEARLIKKLNRGDVFKKTGANKLDIALHFIYRGCLLNDPEIINIGATQSFIPLAFTNKEGIQYDYSYQQHGPQIYIGGYGSVLVNTELQVASYLQGTSYALSGTKLKILSKFVLNTYAGVHRGKYMDFSVTGRGIANKNTLSNEGFTGTLEKLKLIDAENANKYDVLISRFNESQPPSYDVKKRHTQFWESDFTLHNDPSYAFSVRTSSTRTSKSENGNKANLKGYFLAEGATSIRVDGDEYYNIFPVWQWSKIPGVTAPKVSNIPIRHQWSVLGTSEFTGGVTDSIYGATAYVMKDFNTEAKKGWFFFEEEIVCLGSGINATADEKILTTINQCYLDGSIIISENNKTSTVPNGNNNTNDNIDCILHDKIAYFFPDHGNVRFTNGSQTGNWYEINKNRSKDMVSEAVFTLWLDHGVKPKNATYSYIVTPNKDINSIQKYDSENIVIVENSKDIQAVYNKKLDVMEVIFYTPNKLNYKDVNITVDKPCVLLLKNIKTPHVNISIADPSQQQAAIKLIAKLPEIKKSRVLTLNLPTGNYAGSSLPFVIDSNTPVFF
ncbi:hypothetical protein JM658_06030 [Joostella atrarenae]|uniref:Chondroitin AC lyase n=1 Tax=Joostella atrarenae TaxID=679257 RepID=A0ABS9J1R8_9FLAO|nr:polysaccharide lyase family 8 super-sandwich domain-containing protein [Joostella atrarenae]MCF8714385.1 hypothetical protein [Joostella atrarenae]